MMVIMSYHVLKTVFLDFCDIFLIKSKSLDELTIVKYFSILCINYIKYILILF